MAAPYQIALLGFPDFERNALESFFKLATRRTPGFATILTEAHADVWLVNASDTQLVMRLRAMPAHRVLAIGASPLAPQWPHLVRPIQLMMVLDTIEKILLQPLPSANPVSFQQTQPFQLATMPFARAAPQFEMTQPFAPLDMAKSSAAKPPGSDQPLLRPRLSASTAGDLPDNSYAQTEPAPLEGLTPSPAAGARPAAHERVQDEITPDMIAQYRRAQPLPAAPVLSPWVSAPQAGASPPASVAQAEVLTSFGLARGPSAVQTPAKQAPGEADFDDVMIVAVDDKERLRLAASLSRLGYRVVPIRDPQEALARARTRYYGLVFVARPAWPSMVGFAGIQYPNQRSPKVIRMDVSGAWWARLVYALGPQHALLAGNWTERGLVTLLAKFYPDLRNIVVSTAHRGTMRSVDTTTR